MEKSKNKVIIDADFFRHSTDFEIGSGFFEKILSECNYFPVMHRYVADVELKGNVCLRGLIKNNKIQIISEKDFITENDEEYIDYFIQAYEWLNGVSFGKNDPYLYGYKERRNGESLGEIRSFYLAIKKGYKVLLSDDNDARILWSHLRSTKCEIVVEGLYELLIRNREENGRIRWKDIKVTVSKVFEKRQDRCQELCRLYKEIDNDG